MAIEVLWVKSNENCQNKSSYISLLLVLDGEIKFVVRVLFSHLSDRKMYTLVI